MALLKQIGLKSKLVGPVNGWKYFHSVKGKKPSQSKQQKIVRLTKRTLQACTSQI
jgi:hypothetical protein